MQTLRQGSSGLFEPVMASCDARRVARARLCAQVIIVEQFRIGSI